MKTARTMALLAVAATCAAGAGSRLDVAIAGVLLHEKLGYAVSVSDTADGRRPPLDDDPWK